MNTAQMLQANRLKAHKAILNPEVEGYHQRTDDPDTLTSVDWGKMPDGSWSPLSTPYETVEKGTDNGDIQKAEVEISAG